MKLSMNWLAEWIATDRSADDTAELLTRIGLTVDDVERPGQAVADVVVGRVESVAKHPNADRLSLCTVFDGTDRHPVVCGAPNVTGGRCYPFARVNTTLPGDFTIKKAKIRGEVSMGMLCSAKELGLSDEHEGILDLGDAVEPGQPLDRALGLDDVVLDLDVPYNRPDWMSVRGVARELGAALRVLAPDESGEGFAGPVPGFDEAGTPAPDTVRVSVESSEDCPLYACRVVRGVTIGPSPDWLRRRLEAIGQRSISNVVDVTNYVLHGCGQPIHAFDLGKLRGGEIGVRRARAGETLVTLDGTERTLSPEILAIHDGQGVVALAGVMGGEESEVTEGTTDLLLEAALFRADVVRDGARSLGMDTDAATRFERGIDPAAVRIALDLTAHWIALTAGGEVAPGTSLVGEAPVPERDLALRPSRLEALLGQAVDDDEITTILDALGLAPRWEGDGGDRRVVIRVPSWRADLHREEDLIEEVARYHGYDAFEERAYNGSAVSTHPHPIERATDRSAAVWMGLGFQEIHTPALVSGEAAERALSLGRQPGAEGPIALANAKSRDMDTLRTALWPGHLAVVRHNLHRGVEALRLVEHGKIYRREAGGDPRDGVPGYRESIELAGVLRGDLLPAGWTGTGVPLDLFALKGLLEAWYRSLGLEPPNAEAGGAEATGGALDAESFRLVHPDGVNAVAGRIGKKLARAEDLPEDLWLFSIDFERCVKLDRETPRHRELSRFPAVKRDIALIVPAEVAHAELDALIRSAGGGLVTRVELFDLYEGDPIPAGKKSLAYALSFQSPERSLVAAEVDQQVGAIVSALQRDLGAILRDG